MIRMAVEYLEPGMELGRDIFGLDGRRILASGATLTDKYISVLKRWEILSIYVKNPIIQIPPITDVVEEATRQKVVHVMKTLFNDISKKGLVELSGEQKDVVNKVVSDVIRQRFAMIHLAQIQYHSNDVFSHSVNVSILSAMAAVAMETVASDALYAITLGAMLHDVGMIMVPVNIIAKTDALSPEENEILQGHTKCGFELLRKVEGVPLMSAHIAFQHHEKYNGKGYPRGLSGNEINEISRIVAVANAYDNLVSPLQGSNGLEPHLAYESIVSEVNVSFDADVASCFLSRISVYPVGTLVKLTAGKIGFVTGVTAKMQHRPIIEIVADENGVLLAVPITVNLAEKENLTVFVTEVVNDQEAAAFFKKNQK